MEGEALAVPFVLRSLKELEVIPELADCPNKVREAVVMPEVAPLAAPLTLKSLKDDAAALMLRRIAGLPSRIFPLRPS